MKRRTRMVRPAVFDDEALGRCSGDAFRLYIGLYTLADRAGRLAWNRKAVDYQLFPYNDEVDVEALLQELVGAKLAVAYEASGRRYVYLPGFAEGGLNEQRVHRNEADSEHPAPSDSRRLRRKGTSGARAKVRPQNAPRPPSQTVVGASCDEVEEGQAEAQQQLLRSAEPSTARVLADELAEAIRSHTPKHRGSPAKWERDIDLLLRRGPPDLDKAAPVSPDDVRLVIDFAHRRSRAPRWPGDFSWRHNVLSGKKLRAHFEKLHMQATAPTQRRGTNSSTRPSSGGAFEGLTSD